jgi:hypothetical protein
VIDDHCDRIEPQFAASRALGVFGEPRCRKCSDPSQLARRECKDRVKSADATSLDLGKDDCVPVADDEIEFAAGSSMVPRHELETEARVVLERQLLASTAERLLGC